MDKSRVEPTIFFIEKILFSLKLFSDHFYGQSFIKTVRGPLALNRYKTCVVSMSVQVNNSLLPTRVFTSYWIKTVVFRMILICDIVLGLVYIENTR